MVRLSVADQLTEAHEFVAFEAGKLEGLEEALRILLSEGGGIERLRCCFSVKGEITAQKELLTEMGGDEE